jgi:L-ribulose-5-phosphate 4-epimerase
MRFEELRERVCSVNRGLVDAGLVVLSFGNASGVDRDAGVFAIKPSGVPYSLLQPVDIVVLDLGSGKVVDGSGRPSSDTPTHRILYEMFPTVGGIIHTHSAHAASWAQALRAIPCFGTTHADHFRGPVPVTRPLTDEEIRTDYEVNTGRVIVERFTVDRLDPDEMPACLDASHGPFAWGPSPERALDNAIALELVATMALHTLAIDPAARPIQEALLEKHHSRKHGPGAYYGQPATTD